jgi:hypothetical protein
LGGKAASVIYKRHGTLSLLAGIDLLTGKVHALVRDRHRSREFIAIKLILDNHSAHISRETRAWLDTRPPGRFDFTFTPKHGSWLRREAWNPGHRHDGTGFAASARPPCELRAGS